MNPTTPILERFTAMSRRTQALLALALTISVLLAITVRDVARIDPTSGGYDAPYDDVSGEPIDWLAHDITDTGFRDTGGVVLNASLDCTTGQIRFHVGPFTFDYRTVSERAIVVHRPQDACREVGFEPQWTEPEWAASGVHQTGDGSTR